jgi:hypothetical protein
MQSAAATASMAVQTLPLPNKRAGGIIGSDLTVSFVTDLYRCELLRQEERFTTFGSFSAGAFLCFNPPSYIADSYPGLLSAKEGENGGLPLVLSMYNPVQPSVVDADWESKWFLINARVHPYRLPFHRRQLDGAEEDVGDWRIDKVSLLLPRDNAILP